MKATRDNYIYLLKERLAEIEDMDLSRDERDMLWIKELHALQDEIKRNEEDDRRRTQLQEKFNSEDRQ